MSSANINPEARQVLQLAMVDQAPKIVEFQYEAKSGAISNRRVEPYELRGAILFAHCLLRDEIRQFKLENMSDVRNTGEPFRPRAAIIVPL